LMNAVINHRKFVLLPNLLVKILRCLIILLCLIILGINIFESFKG